MNLYIIKQKQAVFIVLVLLHHLFSSFWSTVRHIAKGEQTYILALRHTHDGCSQALAQRVKSQPKKFLHVGIRDVRDRISDKSTLPKLGRAKPEKEFLACQEYSFRPIDKRSEAQMGHENQAYWWDHNMMTLYSINVSSKKTITIQIRFIRNIVNEY